LPLENKNNKKR